MISITVLYRDLTHQKVPINEIATIPKDNVLFIRLSTDTREGALANISQIQGLDNYAILRRKRDGDTWYMLYGWDDDEYVWRRECDTCNNREMVDAPIGMFHIVFRGVSVTKAKWQQAVTIIDNDL